jgi:hypothetical protein
MSVRFASRVSVAAAAASVALGLSAAGGAEAFWAKAAVATVVVTLRGHIVATRTLHLAGGAVHYREAGRFQVVWRVPASGLRSGRTYLSSSAVVIGTTSATYDGAPKRSCVGRLTVQPRRFLLRVRSGYDPLFASLTSSTTGVGTSPNPIATATSPTCSEGLLAGRWRLVSNKRRQDWWVYNHPGGGFYGSSFTPLPKGGAGDGWSLGWGSAGSFTWLGVFSIRHPASA